MRRCQLYRLVESLYCYPKCLRIKGFCIYLWYYARLLFLNSLNCWISIRFLKTLNPSERTVGYRKDFQKHVNNFFLVFSKFWYIFEFLSKKKFFFSKAGLSTCLRYLQKQSGTNWYKNKFKFLKISRVFLWLFKGLTFY